MKYFPILLASLLWTSGLLSQNTIREPAFLGIYSEQLSKEKAHKLGLDNLYGSYVTRIVENSAAERAGVKPFDYIYGIDEYRTGKEQSLTQIIRKYRAGQNATLHLIRKDRKKMLQATFGSRGESKSVARDKCSEPFLGISATSATGKESDGVTVKIIDNSTARAIGMEDGDHIVAINNRRMIDWQDISTAINSQEPGDEISVEFIRQGQRLKKSGPIKSYCETKPEEAVKMEIKVAPQPGEWFNRYFKQGDEKTIIIGRADISRPRISALNAEQAEKLKMETGISLDASNNLPVEGLTVEPEGKNYVLEFTLPGSGKTAILIYNQAGRLIYQYDLGNFSGKFRDEVNLSQNKAGLFYLEVRQGNKSAARQITLTGR